MRNDILTQFDELANTSQKDNWEKLVAGKGLLNPEQRTEFLREFQIADPLNALAKLVDMKNPSRETSLFRIEGRPSQPGYVYSTEGGVTTRSTNGELTPAELKWDPQTITTTKIKGKLVLSDDDLEENIERQNLAQTAINEMGYRMGLDNNYWNAFGDTSLDPSTYGILSCGDGWIKSSGTKLESNDVADGGSGDFNLDDGVTTIFDTLRKNLPHQFKSAANQLVYICPEEVEDAFRNTLINRDTQLGDNNILNWDGLKYKGTPVIHSPTLDDSIAQGIDDTATVILTTIRNIEWNVFRPITVELNRDANNELNEFIFRYKGIPSLERPAGTVTAKISIDEKESIQEKNKVRPCYVTNADAIGGGEAPVSP